MASLKEDNAPPPLAVAGLTNLGNTCYLNAALQAMASSRTFTDCIASLAAAFAATAAPPQQQQHGASLVQQLLAGLHAAATFVLHGA